MGRWHSRTMEKLGRLRADDCDVQVRLYSLNHTHSLFLIHSKIRVLYATQFSDSRWLYGELHFERTVAKTKRPKSRIFRFSTIKSWRKENRNLIFGPGSDNCSKTYRKKDWKKFPTSDGLCLRIVVSTSSIIKEKL